MKSEYASSSEGEEWSGSPLTVDSSVKYLSGAYAHDKNEAIQRYQQISWPLLEHKLSRVREVVDAYNRQQGGTTHLDYG